MLIVFLSYVTSTISVVVSLKESSLYLLWVVLSIGVVVVLNKVYDDVIIRNSKA